MRSSSETARSRRASYQNQRSQTLDALPLQLIHPAPLLSLTDQRNSLDSQDEAGSASEESRLLGSTEGSPFHASRDSGRSSRENHFSGGCRPTARPALAKNLSFQNVLSENGLNHHQRLPSNGGSTRSSKIFLRKSSDNDLLYGCSSTSTRILERSPSSSSALLAKVKDRIVDTFFQTSSEGPHLAAIVQERRQRAAEEYETRLGIFRVQQHQQLQNSRTGSLSSDSGSTERVPSCQNSTRRNRTLLSEAQTGDTDAVRFAKSRREGARAAFRRRSVSEDNCLPQSLLGKSRPVGNGSVAGSQAGLGGIVCSTDDFQALVSGLGHRRGLSYGGSRSRCMGPRAMSFDQSRTLRPCGSLFGDYVPGDSLSQRLNNSSKILETFEEAADCAPHHSDHSLRPDEDDSTCLRNHKNNHLDSSSDIAKNRLSSDSSRVVSPEEASRPQSLRTANNCHHVGKSEGVVSESDSSHVPAFVPEVEFDANGQTWDVYGAELDPEILGNAIQIHLSRLIARTKEEAAVDAQNCHDRLTSGGQDTLVTCPPSPRDRPPVVVAKDCEVPRSREHADIGCLRRYFCVFSSGDDS